MTKSQKIADLLCGAENTYAGTERYFEIEKMVSDYIESVERYCAICGETECYHRKPNALAVPTCDKFNPGVPQAVVILERLEVITGIELDPEEHEFFCEMIAHVLKGE